MEGIIKVIKRIGIVALCALMVSNVGVSVKAAEEKSQKTFYNSATSDLWFYAYRNTTKTGTGRNQSSYVAMSANKYCELYVQTKAYEYDSTTGSLTQSTQRVASNYDENTISVGTTLTANRNTYLGTITRTYKVFGKDFTSTINW